MNKSLCAQAMIFHMTLQILQISFFIQHRISKAKRNSNASKLYTALFSSAQCHENKRWQLSFFRTKTRMVLSPGQGVGQPHITQPRVLEKSARGSLQTQSRAAGATEGMGGSQLRNPGCSGSHPEGLGVPRTCWVTLLISYFAFLCNKKGQKISSQLYCRPRPMESLLQERRDGMPGVLL